MLNLLRSLLGMKPVYKVVKVSDGDTLRLVGLGAVRVKGLDAPELKQKGGKEAQAYLEEIIRNSRGIFDWIFQNKHIGTVTIDKDGVDKYGRTLATVYVMGLDISEVMLTGGQGWRFMDKGKYTNQEDWAKGKRKGVHAGRQEKAEDYRRRMRRG